MRTIEHLEVAAPESLNMLDCCIWLGSRGEIPDGLLSAVQVAAFGSSLVEQVAATAELVRHGLVRQEQGLIRINPLTLAGFREFRRQSLQVVLRATVEALRPQWHEALLLRRLRSEFALSVTVEPESDRPVKMCCLDSRTWLLAVPTQSGESLVTLLEARPAGIFSVEPAFDVELGPGQFEWFAGRVQRHLAQVMRWVYKCNEEQIAAAQAQS